MYLKLEHSMTNGTSKASTEQGGEEGKREQLILREWDGRFSRKTPIPVLKAEQSFARWDLPVPSGTKIESVQREGDEKQFDDCEKVRTVGIMATRSRRSKVASGKEGLWEVFGKGNALEADLRTM